MSEKKTQLNRKKSARKHRVGRVTIYLRGKIWYIYYCENGKRVRRCVGVSLGEAKRLAAQVNAQLATHTPAILSFQPVSTPNLRQGWLNYHEQVLRSSLATIRRYRAATDHLLHFVETVRTVNSADAFTVSTSEEFAQYLRRVKVSPNGHPNTSKRLLRDKGVIFILETCRAEQSPSMRRWYSSTICCFVASRGDMAFLPSKCDLLCKSGPPIRPEVARISSWSRIGGTGKTLSMRPMVLYSRLVLRHT